MKFALTAIHYTPTAQGPVITMRGRQLNGQKASVTVQGAIPWFCVDEDPRSKLNKAGVMSRVRKIVPPEKTNLYSITGEPLWRVETILPGDVGGQRGLRTLFSRTYEADVPFDYRFRVDSGIRYGVEVPDGLSTVRMSDVKPTKIGRRVPLRILDFDFEMDDSQGKPTVDEPTEFISFSAYDRWTKTCYMGIVVKYVDLAKFRQMIDQWIEKNNLERLDISKKVKVRRCESESELFAAFKSVVEKLDPDIITGWNAFQTKRTTGFDFPIYEARAMTQGYAMLKIGRKSYPLNHSVIDLMGAYARLMDVSVFQSLEDVATKVLGVGKVPRLERVSTLREDDPAKLLLYNWWDAVVLRPIDESMGLTEFHIDVAAVAGVDLADVFWESIVAEQTIFHSIKRMGLNIVTPSKASLGFKPIEGAWTADPVKGLFDNVVVLDFSAEYPSLMMTFNISPDTKMIEDDGNVYKLPTGRMYRRDPPGLGPLVLGAMLERRKNLKKERDQHEKGSSQYQALDYQQRVMKEIANAVYGNFSSKYFRLGDSDVGNDITFLAREHIKWTRDVLIRKGYKFLYGDSVRGNTPVIVRQNGRIGVIPIEDLHTGALHTNNRISINGVDVWTDSGFQEIQHSYRHRVKKKCYRILTGKGFIEATEDHSFVVDGKEISPVDLKVGDKLELVPFKLNGNVKVPTDLAWLFGFFAADGTSVSLETGVRLVWRIANKDKTLLERGAEILPRYGFDAKIDEANDGSGMCYLRTVSHTYLVEKEQTKTIIKWFECATSRKSREKIVPAFILSASKKSQEAYFEGYLVGDGAVEKGNIVSFGSSDRSLLQGLIMIIERLGHDWYPSVRKDKPDHIRVRIRRESPRRLKDKDDIVRKIESFDLHDDVYDLETANHHFCGGLGSFLLHNTDSCLIDIPGSMDEVVEKAQTIAKELNEMFPRFVEEMGGDPTRSLLDIKVDQVFDRWFQAGRKKRYIGTVGWLPGKGDIRDLPYEDRCIVKGFEIRRRNVPSAAKDLQWNTGHEALTGGDPRVPGRALYKKVIVGDIPLEEILIPASFNPNIETHPAHFRAAEYANQHMGMDIASGDDYWWCYASRVDGAPATDVVATEWDRPMPENVHIDWGRMAERVVTGPLEAMMEGLGISMAEITTGQQQVKTMDFLKLR